jgi:predicted extracellular nuclease
MTTKLGKLLPFALTLSMLIAPATAKAELFFSEYIEGSSNNKALEIFNPTGAAVNLAAGGYDVQMFFNGSATAGLTIALTGSVTPGDVYVLAQASAAAAILAQADQTDGAGWYNGDDAVVLRKAGMVIDVIGQIGFDPGVEWGTGLTSTMDNTLRRLLDVSMGDPNGGDAFDPSVQWIGFAIDTFDGLGSRGVAEPGSLALLAVGLAGVALVRRRRVSSIFTARGEPTSSSSARC